MWNLLQAGLVRAVKISSVGITLGSLAGAWSWWIAGNADEVGEITAKFHWGLFVLPLLTLLSIVINDINTDNRDLYKRHSSAYSLLAIAGLFGSILASLLFYAIAANAAAIFNQLDVTRVQLALLTHINLLNTILVVVMTTVGAVAIAVWAHRHISSQSLNR